MELTILQLAKRIDAKLVGDGSGIVDSVGPVEAASNNQVTFVASAKHLDDLAKSGAAAVIVGDCVEGVNKSQLVVGNVNKALIETLKIFAPELKAVSIGIDPTAVVADSASIAETASVGALAVIEDGVEIGGDTVIGSGCKIGQNTKIGSRSRLDSNVVVYHNCEIGNNVVIQANCTIGSTGFGYSFIEGAHRLIPHNGIVVIEDFVEIGANCCIDRAKFCATRLGAGTKVDNLVQIAHNAVIGKCCLIAGQVGLSGNCRIGDGVVLAGKAGVADNVKVGGGVMAGGGSGIFNDVKAGEQVFGTPAGEKNKQLRMISAGRRLPEFIKKVKDLTRRVKKLEDGRS